MCRSANGFPILHTRDLPLLAAFYVERIGCVETYRFGEEYAGLEGPLTLGLAAVEQLEPPGRAALWLYCDDVDAEVEALRAGGVEVTREPADMEWGERMAAVRDPDGNEVFIGSR